ncbi:hypothetical protein [Bdellovibrio svalbardensis]|uniref:Uncharacterized protein n=1 Tax=Bdellovibrio svalbardensis TaxID=2972972 RepID=A0ABT6DIA6_9BACT|nr:hypothetical protein [Bdellovibrio svalbardensis]MDG0816578.1 hypothetical protein [Bdellovibrio svalbardensis]
MRSRNVVKRTIPCLAVVLAVTMQGNMAHAGILDAAKAMVSAILKKSAAPTQQTTSTSKSNAQAATHTAQTATANAAAAVQVDAGVVESVEETTWKSLMKIQDTINNYYVNANSATDDIGKLRGAAQVKIVKVTNVNNEHHSRIIPQYTDKDLVLTVQVDDTALKNPELLVKDISVLMTLTHLAQVSMNSIPGDYAKSSALGKLFDSPHSWTEGYFNATEGSLVSQARMKNIEMAIMQSNVPQQALQTLRNGSPTALPNGEGQISADIVNIEKQVTELNQKAEKFARQQQKALDKWRSETGSLDKLEAMELKLNDLMLKNDRKGVRDMLEAYLPWQIMEPTEYKAWKTWLEAIEHPDLSKTTVAFRGLDYKTDKIQRMETIKGGEEKFAFMSTVLTKNQGSYTRRLRSLTTNREKNGDEGQKVFGDKAMAIKITDQMTAHARDPKASSFLSFTYNPFVAMRFLGSDVTKTIKGEQVTVPNGGLLAVRVDSRRMVPNVVSMYANEIELLAPLIIFPDEVVAYHEGDFNNFKEGKDGSTRVKEFIAQISAKTGTDFSGWGVFESSAPFKERFKKDGLTFFRELSQQSVNAPFCSKIF